MNRALIGALLTAAAYGLTIGVYESCWTLLLESRHAVDWQIGLSWTLFAGPVRRRITAGRLAGRPHRSAVARRHCTRGHDYALCCAYPFIANIWPLLILGGVEALGMAIALPAAQSLLTQGSPEHRTGKGPGSLLHQRNRRKCPRRGCRGSALWARRWAPFCVRRSRCRSPLAASLPFVWRTVTGRVSEVSKHHELITEEPTIIQA